MTLRCLFLTVFFGLAMVSSSLAQTLCTFDGTWELSQKKFNMGFYLANGGEARFSGDIQDGLSAQFDVVFKDFRVLLFDITTQAKGAIRLLDAGGKTPSAEIFLRQDEKDPGLNSHRALQGKVDIVGEKVFVRQLQGAGVRYEGQISFLPPYDMDLVLTFHEMLLSDLFAWLGQPQENVSGDVSGNLRITGFLEKPFIKGKLFSSGEIGGFRYDEIAVGFEGAYPIVRLLDSSVTEASGVSFFLEGKVDLSKDFKDFPQQIAKMKMLPLIRQTDVDREWTIRRGADKREGAETEFKYRLRRERENSGAEESGMLTIQRSIKF